jgi:Ca2+-binding EF-hand superfamily protein
MESNSVEDLKLIFDFLDKDRSGGLSEDELQCGFSILRLNLAALQVRNIVKAADLNQDGKVDFQEFVKLCYIGAAKDKIREEDLVRKLAPYDKENNGKIDVNDLRLLLSGEGEPLEDEDIDDVVRELDVSADGKIDIQDMVHKFLT